MSATHYLAVDLGAESGRVMLGSLTDGRLVLEEIHRFVNRSVTIEGHQHWDLPHLEKEIDAGLEKAAQRGTPISGISTDSWGVDYILIDDKGQPLAKPFCYRDARTDESPARLFTKVPFSEIYEETGIQFMAINTLYQFEAEERASTTQLKKATRFLNIADYFNARFSGVQVAEQSLASTTQIYNPRTQTWSKKLVSTLGISPTLYPKIVPSGTVLGPLTDALRRFPSLAETKAIATCSHDTGAAVAAVPAAGHESWAYLSSGTWSLLGAELKSPVISEASRTAGFTNEAGLGGTTRFLKNIAGLWLAQECRRAWEAAGTTYNYDDLVRLAEENGPATAILSMDDPRFVTTGGMPEKIAAYCRETNQPVPTTPGAFIRTILESLALCYAQTFAKLEELTGQKITKLHIVGGGSRNNLLNQLTANATKLTVITGPVEATAIGNVLIQALALGHIQSATELRHIVEASFPTRTFIPAN